MQKIVPQDVREVPHAFESVGHIAHLNLRDELLPYKHIIGQVTPLTLRLVRAVVAVVNLFFIALPVPLLKSAELPTLQNAVCLPFDMLKQKAGPLPMKIINLIMSHLTSFCICASHS